VGHDEAQSAVDPEAPVARAGPRPHEQRVASPLGHATVTMPERAAIGRAKRALVRRSRHGTWTAAANRPDPVALLASQEDGRLPDLLSLRRERMAVDPFAFFRGAAIVQAWDLAHAPHTDLFVQTCGDAHMMNFGIFAAPSRELVFDVNDFDETLPGPWDFDLKRLVASLMIAARSEGMDDLAGEIAVRRAVIAYRRALNGYAQMSDLSVWYSRIRMSDVTRLAAGEATLSGQLQRSLRKARRNTAERAHAKIVEAVSGREQFRNDPPTLVRLVDLPPDTAGLLGTNLNRVDDYLRTLPDHLRVLLQRYEPVDVARKVVGVGSVGTHCYVVLLQGRRMNDPLILQVKQAVRSVYEDHLRRSRYRSSAARVVAGQHLMQAATDPFLGWFNAGSEASFYVRQFRDAKGGLDVAVLNPQVLAGYGALCAWALARAHARSGDSIAISAYLGTGPVFDNAMVTFAGAYADQNQRDYERFVAETKR
jgi:uncharacterized protein (DUF2252 family)